MRAHQLRQGLTISALALICLWLISLIWGLVGKARVAVEEAHSVQADYQALEERKATLQANLDALNTERGKDAAIRTAFGVARPGEEVIVVVPPATATPTTTPSWWEKIWAWF